ncbi:porin [Phytohalomonas tamaricis]|uniref:porin n=1 Tax=Phytohalomonas tamaricis TaxID=2081032 RepID=UPI000D0B2234|nr:porin [Phytohalomonas tamaricis]
MKKTLLATAIAGALGIVATGAQAATVYNQDGSKLDLYGNIQLSIRSIEAYENDADNSHESQSDLFDNGSTLGVKGEHTISPNLTGYFRAEFEFNADEQKGYYQSYDAGNSGGSGLSRGDQSYMGLTGNFGDLRVGSWDSLFDDWIADPISNNEYFDNTDAAADIAGSEYEGDKIAYTSPILGGFQFVVGTQYKGDADSEVSGSPVDNDLTASRAGRFYVDDNNSASLFGGLRYTTGALTLAAVYDNLKNFQFEPGTTVGDNFIATGGDRDYGSLYGVNAAYELSDTLRVSVNWNRLDADWNSDADVDRYGLGARWNYGMGDLYGSYVYVDAESNAVATIDPRHYNAADTNDESYNEFILGATYNLSSQMYTYIEAATYDREDHIGDGVAFGAAYSF